MKGDIRLDILRLVESGLHVSLPYELLAEAGGWRGKEGELLRGWRVEATCFRVAHTH